MYSAMAERVCTAYVLNAKDARGIDLANNVLHILIVLYS